MGLTAPWRSPDINYLLTSACYKLLQNPQQFPIAAGYEIVKSLPRHGSDVQDELFHGGLALPSSFGLTRGPHFFLIGFTFLLGRVRMGSKHDSLGALRVQGAR